MSRYYGMSVKVTEFDPSCVEEIEDAANKEWDFADGWFLHKGVKDAFPTSLSSHGEGSLCGGEGEEEFADRLTRAVWKANGGFCKVEINATYLEDLPYETYEQDEDDYEKFVKEDGLKDDGKGENE